jgi:hypothetical protein
VSPAYPAKTPPGIGLRKAETRSGFDNGPSVTDAGSIAISIALALALADADADALADAGALAAPPILRGTQGMCTTGIAGGGGAGSEAHPTSANIKTSDRRMPVGRSTVADL